MLQDADVPLFLSSIIHQKPPRAASQLPASAPPPSVNIKLRRVVTVVIVGSAVSHVKTVSEIIKTITVYSTFQHKWAMYLRRAPCCGTGSWATCPGRVLACPQHLKVCDADTIVVSGVPCFCVQSFVTQIQSWCMVMPQQFSYSAFGYLK